MILQMLIFGGKLHGRLENWLEFKLRGSIVQALRGILHVLLVHVQLAGGGDQTLWPADLTLVLMIVALEMERGGLRRRSFAPMVRAFAIAGATMASASARVIVIAY